jgi:hypothetical protein
MIPQTKALWGGNSTPLNGPWNGGLHLFTVLRNAQHVSIRAANVNFAIHSTWKQAMRPFQPRRQTGLW